MFARLSRFRVTYDSHIAAHTIAGVVVVVAERRIDWTSLARTAAVGSPNSVLHDLLGNEYCSSTQRGYTADVWD